MNYPKFIKPFDIEAKRKEILEAFKIKSQKLDYIPIVGDDYMVLIDIFLFEMAKMIEFVNHQVANNYINFSSGEYLDELVALIGLKRIKATKPTAKIEVTASTPTFLAKGTKFTDGDNSTAFLLDDLFVDKKATAVIELSDFTDEIKNTDKLQISNPYITAIKIIEPFKGFKRDETDKELRERFLLSLHRFSTAGSREAYEFFILSDNAIKKTSVYKQSAGVVAIVYLSDLSNDIAEAKIKESLEGRIPLTDNIVLKPANKVNCDLTINVNLKDNLTLADFITNATNAITKLFSELKIGENIHQSRIVDTAFLNQKDVYSVEVTSQIPSVNQDSILVLRSVNIQKALNA